MCFGDKDEARLAQYHKKMAKQYCYYDEEERGKKPGGHGAPRKPNVVWAIPNQRGEDEFTDIYLCPKCKAAWEDEKQPEMSAAEQQQWREAQELRATPDYE